MKSGQFLKAKNEANVWRNNQFPPYEFHPPPIITRSELCVQDTIMSGHRFFDAVAAHAREGKGIPHIYPPPQQHPAQLRARKKCITSGECV